MPPIVTRARFWATGRHRPGKTSTQLGLRTAISRAPNVDRTPELSISSSGAGHSATPEERRKPISASSSEILLSRKFYTYRPILRPSFRSLPQPPPANRAHSLQTDLKAGKCSGNCRAARAIALRAEHGHATMASAYCRPVASGLK
jgi:hypothetical protein